jgi:hypothetical protein
MIVRFRRWLADVISPDTGTTVVAGEHCHHLTAADTELSMHQLLTAAVTDTQKFAAALAGLGGCPACSLSVLAQLVYTLAGFVFDQEHHADDEPRCSCEDPVAAEVIALRLTLCVSGDNDHFGVADALAGVIDCQSCLLSVLFALMAAHITVLEGTTVAWRPLLERQLLAMLDEGSAK